VTDRVKNDVDLLLNRKIYFEYKITYKNVLVLIFWKCYVFYFYLKLQESKKSLNKT